MTQKIGIIGAGQMGTGICQVALSSGFKAALCDISSEQLDTAKGRLQQKIPTQMANVSFDTSYKNFNDCDFIIEAATENEAIKEKMLKEVCANLPEHAIIATNTSSLSITRLAATTDRPEKFIGLHFMNPAPVMKLVEIIKGDATSSETFEKTKKLASTLGKEFAISANTPGFIVNRLLIPMLNEASNLVQEKVGTVEGIDKALKLGANFPMGPLALADLIGLDTCLSIMKILEAGLNDKKYAPSPLLSQKVSEGHLGRKSGKGFYEY
jgi:3-hydroxybutyryl-CoA dehydrogenase